LTKKLNKDKRLRVNIKRTSNVAGVAAWVSTNPDNAYLATFLTSAGVFAISWFVPDYLNHPFCNLAMIAFKQEIEKKGGVDRLPRSNPDFEIKSWVDPETNLKIDHGKVF
jgi:hypothetical protein